jgi:hypothetical protein
LADGITDRIEATEHVPRFLLRLIRDARDEIALERFVTLALRELVRERDQPSSIVQSTSAHAACVTQKRAMAAGTSDPRSRFYPAASCRWPTTDISSVHDRAGIVNRGSDQHGLAIEAQARPVATALQIRTAASITSS